MVWHGMAWYGMAWYGMAWYGMVWWVMPQDLIHDMEIDFHPTTANQTTIGSAQWCQHVGKVSGPENTSKHPNLSEVCFLALFLWL